MLATLVNEKTLLGDGGRDRHDIHLLKGILAEQVGGHVAGNGDDRHGIAVGVGDAGHEIGRSRTRGRQTHAHFPGRPREALGGMGGALFVLDTDAANPVFLEHIENFQVRAAWIAEQHVDAFERQALRENLRPAQRMGTVFRRNLGQRKPRGSSARLHT